MRLTFGRPGTQDSPAFLTRVQSVPRTPAIAAVCAGLLVVFLLDRVTGAAPVQHLYYVPIIFAAIRFGFRGGIAGSLVAIAGYHLANPRLLSFGHQEADALQIGLFAAIGPIAAKLATDARRLHQLAMTDDLTGLHNLRSFERRLTRLIQHATSTNGRVALLVLDLDRLKSINDQYGHLAGAEAVRTVGRLIADHVPAHAVACRYGGDEFVIALQEGPATRAHEIAEGLRRAVQATAPVLAGVPFPAGRLSVSIGIARRTFGAEGRETTTQAGDALFRQADRALYVAKARGRDGVHVA